MDQYTAEAYEHVRQRIVGHIDRLEKYGKQGSGDVHNVKNWRRFGAGFAWDPEVYVDIMKNPEMSDADLMSALRGTEARFMKKWQAIDSMPMHHKVALRTGGDLGLRTPVDVWMETRKRIYDRFGFNPGNGSTNLNGQSQMNEIIHQGKPNPGKSALAQAGTDTQVLLAINQARQDNVILHRKGQFLLEKPDQIKTLIGASSKEQADALEEAIIGQIDRFKQATDYERTKIQNGIFNDGLNWFVRDADEATIDAFSPTRAIDKQEAFKAIGNSLYYTDPQTGLKQTIAESAALGFVTGVKPDYNPNNFSFDALSREGKKAIKLVKNFGSMHLNIGDSFDNFVTHVDNTRLAAMDPITTAVNTGIKNVVKNPLGAAVGAASFIEPEAVKSLLQGNPGEAALQTVVGAGLGSTAQAALPRIGNFAMRLAPRAGAMVLSKVAPLAPALGPLGMAYAAYEMADAVVEGTTGQKIHQHTEEELNKTQEKDPEYFSQNIGSLMPF